MSGPIPQAAFRTGTAKVAKVKRKYLLLNEAGLAAIREYYLAGYTAKQIAEMFGTTRTAIKSHLVRMGVSKRVEKDNRAAVAECIAEGMSFRQTGEVVGISTAAAKRVFARIKDEMGAQAV